MNRCAVSVDLDFEWLLRSLPGTIIDIEVTHSVKQNKKKTTVKYEAQRTFRGGISTSPNNLGSVPICYVIF